jgi:Zn-dependent membrane protease YugP
MIAIPSIATLSTTFLAYYGQPVPVTGGGFGGMGLWIALVIGTLALSGIASMMVRSAYNRYSQVPASSGLTGAQLAQRILDSNGIHDVSIHATPGHLTDHYDPTQKRLVLSEENFHGTSVAALGVSAHECGHAIQHQRAYAPLQWRMAAVGITQIVANPLFLFGAIILASIGLIATKTALLLIALTYGVMMLFQLVTLPVEFDATARAKKIVPQLGAVADGDEFRGMSKVLDAAAMTYVAAFITSLAWFLYHILPFLIGRRDE